jgi:hypothetical protein
VQSTGTEDILTGKMLVISHNSAHSAFDELCNCVADEDYPVKKHQKEEKATKNQQNVSQ